MKLETFFWHPQKGWSCDRLPPLDSERTLVLVFGAAELIDNPDPLERLKETYPNSHLIGCSTAGEIFDTRLFDNTLAAAVVRFERTQLRAASYRLDLGSAVPGAESFRAGRTLAEKLHRPDLRGVFILADGLAVNGSELIRGFHAAIAPGSPASPTPTITGGLAADSHQFQKTWVIAGGTPQKAAVAAVGFYGSQVQIGFGCQSGWTIFGPERRVTRSQQNVLYDLDGKPALQLYKEYLGVLARDLPASALFFPLAVHSGSSRKACVRTAVSLDEETQSLRLSGNIAQGSLAQLMRGNCERLVDGALAAALVGRHSIRRQGGPGDGTEEPALAIAISGSGRRLVLGERTEEELEVTLEELPPHTRQIGFYSYGEFAPGGVETTCQLHNQTMTLTLIREYPLSL